MQRAAHEPANVYRFFDSKKAIRRVARGLMGEVEIEGAKRSPPPPGLPTRLRNS